MRCIAIALVLATSAVSPVQAQEQLISPPLQGFVTRFEQADARESIREEVPAGETVEDWSRMITTQHFADPQRRISPYRLALSMTQGWAAACPGGSTTVPMTIVRSGRAAVQFRADCPLLAMTGKPESMFFLAISGTAALHVKQVAFRRFPDSEDIGWAEDYLAAVTMRETSAAFADSPTGHPGRES